MVRFTVITPVCVLANDLPECNCDLNCLYVHSHEKRAARTFKKHPKHDFHWSACLNVPIMVRNFLFGISHKKNKVTQKLIRVIKWMYFYILKANLPYSSCISMRLFFSEFANVRITLACEDNFSLLSKVCA